MAPAARSRPCAEVDIHDDHAHTPRTSSTTAAALGELPLNSIHNLKARNTSIESLARQLDNFHIHSDKENKSGLSAETTASQGASEARDTKGAAPSGSQDYGHDDTPLAHASRRLPSTQEQLAKHQEATRIEDPEEFAMSLDAEIDRLQSPAPQQMGHGDAAAEERRYEGADGPTSPADGEERARPASRTEDSVESLDKLQEDVEAAAQDKDEDATTTPVRRPGFVPADTHSGRGKMPERSSSVRKTGSSGDDSAAGPGSATSSARKVPRPASLLPPKLPAKSSKPPTVPAFELPGEAVARRLKEQRELRRSQQMSAEQAAAAAAAYSPSKPHFKSSKPPTVPAFELPGEAISRRKREKRERQRLAEEEEERRRREFKAKPMPASLSASTLPRETLTSRARQRSRAAEGSSDSAATTITPVSKKRLSAAGAATFSAGSRGAMTTPTTSSAASHGMSATLPIRGRASTTTTTTTASRGTSASVGSIRSQASSRVSAEEAAQQRARGKEVAARDAAYRTERERERREREEMARAAREQAAERSREKSRLWAEKQRAKKEAEAKAQAQANADANANANTAVGVEVGMDA